MMNEKIITNGVILAALVSLIGLWVTILTTPNYFSRFGSSDVVIIIMNLLIVVSISRYIANARRGIFIERTRGRRILIGFSLLGPVVSVFQFKLDEFGIPLIMPYLLIGFLIASIISICILIMTMREQQLEQKKPL